ncbi:hypothetical protein [Pseudodesulfovibrio senegalensis]|uniref:Uncharacterized protein n=1 Tax=Pseudodesulfovibrio senegalensis TaxID=1721087 RepID=A0A6N6N1M8_9BACT|nr:hypothetical protein [Pseudodesulfovibrio senegalensis]KAB1441716.1 hypothetical protein F8A88_08970 [Pseudodesulfovibrio senegalensis]
MQGEKKDQGRRVLQVREDLVFLHQRSNQAFGGSLSRARLGPERRFAALAERERGRLRAKRSFLPSFFLRQQKKKVALEGETFNKCAFAVCNCASAQ